MYMSYVLDFKEKLMEGMFHKYWFVVNSQRNVPIQTADV